MADEFANPPLPVEHIPQLVEDDFVLVDPRYRQAVLGSLIGIAAAVIIATIGLVVASSSPLTWIIIGAAVLVVVLAIVAIRGIELRRLGYQLREHDVSLRAGALNHRVETIPFSRVQHVTIQRGPVDRLLGLARIDVSSAGPDLSIPGLAADDAARIKQLITDRADVDDDNDDDDGAEP